MIIDFKDYNINTDNMILSFNKENNPVDTNLKELQLDLLNKMQHKVINSRSKIETLIINNNNICMGRCVYCYNEHSNNINCTSLSLENLITAINRLKNEYGFKYAKVVRFFGGEPLLNPDWDKFIHFLVDNGYIDNKTDILISSGLLFSDDIFYDVIRKLFLLQQKGIYIRISCSVDFGMKEFTRKNIANVTQDDLIKRLIILYNNETRIAFTNNMTNDLDVDLFEEQLRKSYDLLNIDKSYLKNKEFLETGILHPNTVPVVTRVSIVAHNKYTPDEFLIKQLEEKVRKMDTYNITTNLFSFNFVLEGANIKKINDDKYLIVYYPFYCGIYSQMVEIFPDGNFGACHMDILNKNYILTKDNPDYDLLFNKECIECKNRLFCRHGCINRRKFVTDIYKRKMYCKWVESCYKLSWERIATNASHSNLNMKQIVENKSKEVKELWNLATNC